MSTGANLEIIDAALATATTVQNSARENASLEKNDGFVNTSENLRGPNGEEYPTDEEWATLRRVYGKVSWMSMHTPKSAFCII
jgi:POT family proton-dependent oligopeptide transporter